MILTLAKSSALLLAAAFVVLHIAAAIFLAGMTTGVALALVVRK